MKARLAGRAFIVISGIRMARGMKRRDPTAGNSEPGRPLGPCLAALAATLLMTWGMPAHRIAVAFVPAGSASAHGALAFLMVTALSIAGIAWIFRSVADAVETGAARSALRWGVLAFALHGCVDFGFSHDGALAAAVLAGSLAWPGRPREASVAWRLVAARVAAGAAA